MRALKIQKKHWLLILIGVLTALLYLLFAYDLERTNFIKLISVYSGLFILSVFLVKYNKDNFKVLAGLALFFRFLFLFAIPNLSQDFYRFIWDGSVILEGFNPYLYTPDSLISNGKLPIIQSQTLYNGMGGLSSGNYTNYPPLHQLIFTVAALISGNSILGSVIVMRLFIILADLGILYFGKKLLDQLNLPMYSIFLYLLNPLIIIELTGNLHFEGIMVSFLIISLYFLNKHKTKLSAIALSFSVLVKLIPLMFLPFFILKLNKKKRLGFITTFLLVSTLAFLPFFSFDFTVHFIETVGLWFNKFEFNGSIYYLVRAIGFKLLGYNIIGTYGFVMVIITVLFIGVYLIKNMHNTSTQQIINGLLICESVYYFLSTTIHPWYIATLIALTVFSKYRFPLVWSFTIMLSYYAYGKIGFRENLWLITLEYVPVFGFFVYEVVLKKQLGDEQIDNLNKN